MSFKNSSQKSIHKLHFHNEESGSVFLEVLFTFVAQLFLSLGVIILFTQIARAEVMSFQEWKKSKVTEAQVQNVVPEKAPPALVSVTASKASKAPKIEASKLALQIAQELTIEDYFALYLSQFRDRSDFTDAAKKLSPGEMADLLLTLKGSMDKSNSNDAPQNLSFSNLTAPDSSLKK
jgi:hypothetical protein